MTDVLLFFGSGARTSASTSVALGWTGSAAPLGAEGRLTEDRFRFPGVDPASRVMVDILLTLWVEKVVDDPRSVVEPLAMAAEVDVDDPRSHVDLEEARARLEEEEPILLEVEAPRFCLEIDLILHISSLLSWTWM